MSSPILNPAYSRSTPELARKRTRSFSSRSKVLPPICSPPQKSLPPIPIAPLAFKIKSKAEVDPRQFSLEFLMTEKVAREIMDSKNWRLSTAQTFPLDDRSDDRSTDSAMSVSSCCSMSSAASSSSSSEGSSSPTPTPTPTLESILITQSSYSTINTSTKKGAGIHRPNRSLRVHLPQFSRTLPDVPKSPTDVGWCPQIDDPTNEDMKDLFTSLEDKMFDDYVDQVTYFLKHPWA